MCNHAGSCDMGEQEQTAIEKKRGRMMTEAEFLAGAYKTCPGRVEIKDMKWTKKQRKEGWPETMAAVREDGEPLAYCKGTPGGPDDNMWICQRVRKSGECPALVKIREAASKAKIDKK